MPRPFGSERCTIAEALRAHASRLPCLGRLRPQQKQRHYLPRSRLVDGAACAGVKRRLRALLVGCLCIVVLGGCASQGTPAARTQHALRTAIERYIGEVEPIRIAVNRLLGGADPILEAFRDRRIGPREAARRMGRLEQRFATYAVAIAAVDPPAGQLRALNSGYADTYVLEDAYLSALVAGLAADELTDLPNTQAAQRAAIIRWRIGLTVLAGTAGARLPGDLQQAGRGEIAPSPSGG